METILSEILGESFPIWVAMSLQNLHFNGFKDDKMKPGTKHFVKFLGIQENIVTEKLDQT